MAVDLSPIFESFLASDVVIGVMSVTATLFGVYLVIFACVNIFIVLRGGEAWSWGLGSHLDYFDKASRDNDFKRRYHREAKSREYREWKKSKGYPSPSNTARRRTQRGMHDKR